MKWNQMVLAVALVSGMAVAAPSQFKSCNSDIVTEVFILCPGEHGVPTPCGSQVTKWGAAVVDLGVDSQQKTATASVIYTPVNGKVTPSPTRCTLDQYNWMECVTTTPVSELGALIVSFNIDGIKDGVYFVDIFADATNVPVGGFQTEMDCQPKATR